MKSYPKQSYLYVTLTVVMGTIAVALFNGWLFPDRTMRTIVGVVCLLASLGGIARAYNAPARSREREAAALHADLRAQIGATGAQQERNRLARDLHDSIKQQLFSIQMSAAAAQARWESDSAGAWQAMSDVRARAREALTEMNALLQQLSPAPLEKVGLVQALRDQCEALGYRTEASVTVSIGNLPDDDDFPPGAQEALFRVAQEALSNVARHARARHVTLSLGQPEAQGPVVLEIRDDGQGFDPSATPGGMGLNNIRQRVEALGGKLDLQSAPGTGVTLRVAVSLTSHPIAAPASPLINTTILIGLVGGLALGAALFYPLYVLLPHGVISGWPTGSPVLGALCVLAAVGLTVSIGFEAARRSSVSRAGALACGALAGSTAGLIAYMALGATAAGIPALRWMQGPYPAWMAQEMALSHEPETVPLMYTMVAIVTQTQGVFWLTLLSGVGLGTLGGWLASRRAGLTAMPDLSRQIFSSLSLGSIFTGLILFVIVTGYSGTADISQPVDPAEMNIVYLFQGFFTVPLVTTLLFYLAAAGGLYGALRADIRQGTHAALGRAQITVVLLGSYSLGIALLALWRFRGFLLLPTPWRVLPNALLIGCAGLGGLYWLALREVQPRWRALGLGAMHVPQVLAGLCLLISLPALLTASRDLPLGAGVFILAADVLSLIVLWKRPTISLLGESAHATAWHESDLVSTTGLGLLLAILLPVAPYLTCLISLFTLLTPELTVAGTQRAFLTQAWVSGGALLVGVVMVGLSVLVLDGIMVLVRARKA